MQVLTETVLEMDLNTYIDNTVATDDVSPTTICLATLHEKVRQSHGALNLLGDKLAIVLSQPEDRAEGAPKEADPRPCTTLLAIIDSISRDVDDLTLGIKEYTSRVIL